MAVGRIENGKPAPLEVFGTAKPDTVFAAASLTKQVTAYIALALRDKGVLDFEKPLVDYVDDLHDPRSRKSTLRHVLSHSAGFPNWRFEEGQKLTSAFEPGERWQYSGEGYVYLQRIIEKVNGRAFSEVAEEIVFRPLAMRSTAMAWTPALADRCAVPHRKRGEAIPDWDRDGKALYEYQAKLGHPLKYEDSVALAKQRSGRTLPNWISPNAAASMVTTGEDYARFVAAAMKNPELRKEQVTMRSGPGWMLGWGLGWGIERVAGREFLWQWGDNGGYKNIVFVEPAKRAALFVFTNGDAGAAVYGRVVREMTGIEHPALLWI